MKKNIFIGLLLMGIATTSVAQTQQASLPADAFEINHNTKTFGFRLPESAMVNDMIFFTHGNGVVVKKVEVTRDILNSGKYSFDAAMLPPGNYVISVAGGSRIKYSFKYSNKPEITTETIKDSKLASTLFSNSKALSFNSTSKEFSVSCGIPFTEGMKIEVLDVQNSVVASNDITKEMITAQKYFVKAPGIQNGKYTVNIDGVDFGTVEFAQ